MKKVILICIIWFSIINTQAQNKTVYGFATNNEFQENEKRIKFNNGTLKICTSSQMNIQGYNGDEVIIRSLTDNSYRRLYTNASNNSGKTYNLGTFKISGDADSTKTNKFRYFINSNNQRQLEQGLKPLGNKSTNPADNLYLDIEEKPGELVIKDYAPDNLNSSQLFFRPNNKYELLIPNNIKLSFNVENCQQQKTNEGTFIVNFPGSSSSYELKDFAGDVEISTSYKSVDLKDVTGSVLVNTIGGNIKVVFDNTAPKKLYSLISKDGYIDIAIPENSSLDIEATGNRILSDLDFKINKDEIVDGLKTMKLQLNKGNIKMKINSGSSSVYLRKSN